MALFVARTDGVLDRYANMLAAAQHPEKALQRALSRTGDKAKTQVIRALTVQTGLKRKVIVRAVKVKKPSFRLLEYSMTTRGGDVSLKYFDPRETRSGVSAAPRGNRQIFAHTFLKGGLFPNRVPLSMGGHVFERAAGARRTPIHKRKSGVYIPQEMVRGETLDAFNNVIARDLPDRVGHELLRMLGG
ncbi:hypothetical protein BA190_10105 [Labrys sp. WJW]|uniref:hypothetical protein n=1 Tax=Labrys sp. WJW TaxID=1737983 RepID=UPI00082BCF8E|nr:hypothetical protein [Labrys sp. WJW]OCC05246.1 hypothetical protein BA190_10105 [Labrys sp. WJW]